MPVILNEPINLLQKQAEDLEYSYLLDDANSCRDPIQRILLVAAFAVSGYASTANRVTRKPFNPLLGETYELVRQDLGFRFISEKVSHHPPIMACHAQGNGWVFEGESLVKSKFWGKSFELIPYGLIHVTLTASGETYTYRKVGSNISGLMERTIQHVGEMNISNNCNSLTCKINFKESGFFSTLTREFTGQLYKDNKAIPISVFGRWDKDFVVKNDGERVLWKAAPDIKDSELFFNFGSFAMQLNELSYDISPHLPPTDSRFRPDQRLYETGYVQEADEVKLCLEMKQRERLSLEHSNWTPKWFKIRDCKVKNLQDYTSLKGKEFCYKGGYWEMRRSGGFPKKCELW